MDSIRVGLDAQFDLAFWESIKRNARARNALVWLIVSPVLVPLIIYGLATLLESFGFQVEFQCEFYTFGMCSTAKTCLFLLPAHAGQYFFGGGYDRNPGGLFEPVFETYETFNPCITSFVYFLFAAHAIIHHHLAIKYAAELDAIAEKRAECILKMNSDKSD